MTSNAETNMKGGDVVEVLNGTATLTMSKDGKTTKLEIKPGFLPLLSLN